MDFTKPKSVKLDTVIKYESKFGGCVSVEAHFSVLISCIIKKFLTRPPC